MKILYIQDSLGTGGAERSNAELWYYLREKGFNFKIVVLEHRKEGIEKEILSEKFDVQFLRSGSFLFEVQQIRKIIKEFDPDLIHSVLLRSNLRARIAQLGLGKIHVESLVNCTYANIRYSDPKINSKILKVYEKIDQFTGKFGVHKFIPITNTVKDHYISKLGVNPKKMLTIPRGRKINEFFSPSNEKIKKTPGSFTFIHVGRQEFQKGHMVLLEAIKMVDDRLFDRGVEFLFCGRKGNASAQIEIFLNETELKTKLNFLGHRNDIPELLVKADVFVFPSIYEGLGGALIEAQAAGLPIVCSDIEVLKEVVNNKNALFHRTNDPNSLAEVLLEILDSDLQEMSVASINNFQENFILENINEKMLSAYNQIIDEN